MIPTPSLRPAAQHSFAHIEPPRIQRSSFDRSFNVKSTFDGGQLIPVYVDEVLPGDTVSLRATFLARLATLQFPIMDNLHFDTFWFYAPARILWDNWKRFNGERATPTQSIDLEIPILSGDPVIFDDFSLGDYFGLPVGINMPNGDDITGPGINVLPFRMYNRVYNDWFRDQNTQGLAYQDVSDGPDSQNNYVVLNRGKRHDYFSSCLLQPQKGDAVALPLGTRAPVVGDGTATGFEGGSGVDVHLGYTDATGTNGLLQLVNAEANVGQPLTGAAPTGDFFVGISRDPVHSHVYADLSGALAANINDLREAIAIQQLLELDARGGTRYIEQMDSMWGVTVPDFRLQRPEYLGGSSDRIDIRAVAQTAPGTTPQASLSAFGQMESQSGFNHSFVEHGYIMCLVNVRADLTYQQGIHKMWSRSTRYDFYQPPLAHLGEQAVLNREIYHQNTSQDLEVFGYQERWAEYRYSVNRVTGAFRSSFATPLDSWHLALDFEELPELAPSGMGAVPFVVDDPPITRVTAGEVADGNQVLLDMSATARWVRPMPVYSTPGLERL